MGPFFSVYEAIYCRETEFVRLRLFINQRLANFFGQAGHTIQTEIVGLAGFVTRIS